MKRIMFFVLIIMFTISCGVKGKKDSPQVSVVWTSGDELRVPESVMYDREAKCLYVSNINGKPTEKNGKGFIAKLSLKGKILNLKWAKGMNAPKGMAINGDTLYVSDIDRIHGIDRSTGRIKVTVNRPDATFLNDLAVSPDGTLYVSDMDSGKIYVLKEKSLEVFIDLKSFQGANGMLMKGAELLVGSKTGIVKVELKTKKAALLVPVADYGMIDGLKEFDDNSFLMSNWQGKTQLVALSGKVDVLLDTTSQKIQSADFEYIAAKRLLIIPTFFNNRVIAYRIK